MTVLAPTASDVEDYLGAYVYDQGQLEVALVAETAAQAKKCRVPAEAEEWPADLAEALKRRVARNLAMRNLPLGVQSNETTAIRLGSLDPEIQRLEAPFRKVPVG